jgi:hypothetical protein
MTVLSIDSGDVSTIERFAATGLITDATTNPLFVSQAAARGSEPEYAAMVDAAVAAACRGYDSTSSGGAAVAGLPPAVPPHTRGTPPTPATLDLAIDCLSVELGKRILQVVKGYVSTEVDIRLSFDAAASEARARRITQLYEVAGVPRSRVLIKLAGTWEGIRAAEALERDGIRCNLTLVFGVCQAIAAAQARATLISPFPGRGARCVACSTALPCAWGVPLLWRLSVVLCITLDHGRVHHHRFARAVLEWVKANGGPQAFTPAEDPGVVACRAMYAFCRRHGHDLICMPASWRSSTGNDALDEVRLCQLATARWRRCVCGSGGAPTPVAEALARRAKAFAPRVAAPPLHTPRTPPPPLHAHRCARWPAQTA